MKKVALTVATIAVLAILSGLFLFRSESRTVDSLGTMWLKYKWGEPRQVEYDTNQDGVADSWSRLLPGADPDQQHLWKSEWSRVDIDFNGIVDIEVQFLRRDGLVEQLIWVDSDEDGEFDQVHTGAEGHEVLDDLLMKQYRIQRGDGL